MSGTLRIVLAALLVWAVAIAPAQAGVPVTPVPQSEQPAAADEPCFGPFDRSPRSAAERPLPSRVRPVEPISSALLAPRAGRPPADRFPPPVPLHVRYCVWRE